jgi:hypothetical protein
MIALTTNTMKCCPVMDELPYLPIHRLTTTVTCYRASSPQPFSSAVTTVVAALRHGEESRWPHRYGVVHVYLYVPRSKFTWEIYYYLFTKIFVRNRSEYNLSFNTKYIY